MGNAISGWAGSATLLSLGAVLLTAMAAAYVTGCVLRRRRKNSASDTQEGYVVSAVLGLLALLLGFTFSLAIDRFDARRMLVLEDSNAIGTAYLRAQLLPEPHRERLTGLLTQLVDLKVTLGTATRGQVPGLVAQDDKLLNDIWAADAAAFDAIKNLDFSSTFIEGMNQMIDLDASRRAARIAHVPAEVVSVLLIYLVVTAGVLGYVLVGRGGQLTGAILLLLFTLSLLLVLDIDRPTTGWIREQQWPMEQLRAGIHSQPPTVYDRWR